MTDLIPVITFTRRSMPIPADYRPLYKIGHILLILHLSSRGGKSSLLRLHFLCWSIKSKRNMEVATRWINSDFKEDFHIWGIEPTVNRALILAKADQLLIEQEGSFLIQQKGDLLIKQVLKTTQLFEEEIKFLKAIGKSTVTESKIIELTRKLF